MSHRRFEIATAILEVIAALGVVTASLVAPNAAGVIASLISKKKFPPYKINRSLKSLLKNNYLKSEKKSKVITYKITNDGKRKLREYNFSKIKITKQTKWDGHLRLVVFDIPNSMNEMRRSFSEMLKKLGFIFIQKSIWAFAYPCTTEVIQIAEFLGIRKYVVILTVNKIENIDTKTFEKKLGLT